MSKSSFKTILSSSIWGILAKTLDAAAKFVTIPMLVGFYGKADYGLIALAFSLNAYLRLMDMGMNIGSIRFFSMWIAQNEYEKIGKVSRSSIVFYGVIGIVNALIFTVMGHFSGSYFKLTPAQNEVFTWMMYILAASTVFNWTSNVINQLLTAHHELAWINKVSVLASVFNFITAFISVKLNLSLLNYFLLYTLSTLIVIPFNIYRLKVYKLPLMELIKPVWNSKAFKEIMSYSMAIFAMGIFQFSADNLRPLLLGKYAAKGIAVLTEYRVMQTIAMLIIAFGGVFLDSLLPSAAKSHAEGDTEKLSHMVYKGTKYISVFLAFIVFGIITDSKVLLVLYMGPDYTELAGWLSLWVLTLMSMHISPVSSIVLSTGKTKAITISSAVSCLLSLPITALLAPKLNVGGAIVGYAAYILIQMSTYYFYYIPKVLKLKSHRILLNGLMPAVAIGAVAAFATQTLQKFYFTKANVQTLLLLGVIFTIMYGALIFSIVIKPSEIKEIKNKIFNKSH